MAENDPTWGKDYELVYADNEETISDRKFRQPDRVCGAKKVRRLGKWVIEKVYRNRLRAQKKLQKKLAARFR